MVGKKKSSYKTLTVSVETYSEIDKVKKLTEKELGVKLSWDQVLSRWAKDFFRWAGAAKEGK